MFGEFGSGNMGNDASFQAVLDALREIDPDIGVLAICRGPVEMTRRFGVPSVPIVFRRKDNPRFPRLYRLLVRVPGKFLDLFWMLHVMGRVDAVVVPGAGVLESVSARAWSLPWALYCVTWAARLRRKTIVFVNVGADRARSPITRLFLRRALLRASYRAYRDTVSRAAAARIGVPSGADPVYPDVAFSLPAPPAAAVRPGSVALGLISSSDWRGTTDQRQHARTAYVRAMSSFATSLLEAGFSVQLVTGDLSDRGHAAEVADHVRRALPGLADDRFDVPQISTFAGLMQVMNTCEVVVASRFHNVICALKLARPVLALSYAPKTDQLMADFGVGEYCHRVDDIDVHRLTEQFTALYTHRAQISARLREQVRATERRLREQRVELAELLGPDGRRTTSVSALTRAELGHPA